MDSHDPRVHRFYRTVGCVFNNSKFFGNVQADDRVVNTSWDFEDDYMWKGMASSYIKTLSSSNGIGYLQASSGTTNLSDEEKLLENILKDKIGSVRKNDHNLST
jgi:hypothetical protein